MELPRFGRDRDEGEQVAEVASDASAAAARANRDAAKAQATAERAQADARAAQDEATVAQDAARAAGSSATGDNEADERLLTEVRSEEFLRDHLPPEQDDPDAYGRLGRPVSSRHPFVMGFLGATGALLALWLGRLVLQAGSVLVLVVVALFLAVGLNPAVEFLMHRGLRRPMAVFAVALTVVAVLALFVVAIVPVITDQASTLGKNVPDWLDQLQHNGQIQRLDEKYDFIAKAKHYIASGDLTKRVFGGVLGVGLAILGALANAFVVIVLTLYFLASLPRVKRSIYDLAPASRRARVSLLGDQVLAGVGGYVSGAFVVALCAGVSTLLLLFAVGLGQYAVALAFVVALLDVIPMIGATLGALIVCAIAFASGGVTTGVICIAFYVLYQQIENYVIYPRVMSRSVDIPGAMTVIAALIGAALLGVIGALLAIPTAAAILLILREVVVRRQAAR